MEKALLIFGPSGVGKSTVSKWLSEDLGLLLFEGDLWREKEIDGIDANDLRVEWNAFWEGKQPSPLYKMLIKRAKGKGKNGAILSLPSIIPNIDLLMDAVRIGFSIAVLYGTGADCMNAFLEEQKKHNKEQSITHWIYHNAQSYAEMSSPEFELYRISTFVNGQRKSRAELVKEVSEKIGLS